jgi:hypothetical protein
MSELALSLGAILGETQTAYRNSSKQNANNNTVSDIHIAETDVMAQKVDVYLSGCQGHIDSTLKSITCYAVDLKTVVFPYGGARDKYLHTAFGQN